MIGHKIKAFKSQIRCRTNNKKMWAIRYENCLQVNPEYDGLLQSVYLAIAKCRLHSQNVCHQAVQQLYVLLQRNIPTNIHTYILLCIQLQKYNILTYLCHKSSAATVLKFIRLIFIQRQEQVNQINDVQMKDIVHGVVGKLRVGCRGRVGAWMWGMLEEIVGKRDVCNAWDMREVDGIVQVIGYFQQQPINYAKCTTTNKQPTTTTTSPTSIINLVQLLQQHIHSTHHIPKQLPNYLKLLTLYLHNNAHTHTHTHIHIKVQKIVTHLLSTLLTCSTDGIGQQNYMGYLRLCTYLDIGEEYSNVVRYLMFGSMNTSVQATLLCLQVLHRISYQQQWLCYSRISPYLNNTLTNLHSTHPTHPTPPHPSILSPVPTHTHTPLYSTCYKLLFNILLNQQKCSHDDYYQILQQMCMHIIDGLQQNALNWRMVDSMEMLVLRLLNVKKEGIKMRVLRVASGMLQFGKVGREFRNKVGLYCRLYGVDDCAYGYGYGYGYGQGDGQEQESGLDSDFEGRSSMCSQEDGYSQL